MSNLIINIVNIIDYFVAVNQVVKEDDPVVDDDETEQELQLALERSRRSKVKKEKDSEEGILERVMKFYFFINFYFICYNIYFIVFFEVVPCNLFLATTSTVIARTDFLIPPNQKFRWQPLFGNSLMKKMIYLLPAD